MEQARADNVAAMDHEWRQWAKLIRKLRWIGMEEEAHRLELAMGTLPPEERGTVLAPPVSTD